MVFSFLYPICPCMISLIMLKKKKEKEKSKDKEKSKKNKKTFKMIASVFTRSCASYRM